MANERWWLIEHKALNDDGKVVYVANQGGSTTLPFDAKRFKTRQEARDNIPALCLRADDWHEIEHIFAHGYRRKRTLSGFIIHWFNRLIWQK